MKVPFFKNRRFYQSITAIISNLAVWNFFSGKLYTGILKAIPFPSMNCYACPASVFSCPIGTLSHLMVMAKFPFYTLGILGSVSLPFGRWICGWICPFGLLQDMLYKIPTPKVRMPKKLELIKFAMLLFPVLILPYFLKKHLFCMMCPVGTLEAGLYWVGFHPEIRRLAGMLFSFKVAVMILIVGGAIFTKRPFCRFFCPLGALFSLFNKVSPIRFTHDASLCTRCNHCQDVCPVDHKIYEDPNSTSCIRCLNCIRDCKALDIEYPSIFKIPQGRNHNEKSLP
ncbi:MULTISPECIES: 4Fe-4S binding protein [unclassified Desulfurobacterium]|uniref:4Fe-4S binding protein n=1 Tax=Desulfurobacterium sp. TC5-1 TaxID=1158318 RepID=UPI0003B38B7C|nr:4Fe-4S binding protein [Desulfurobacterium sp. TC5-1]